MRIYNKNEIAASILLVLPHLGTTSAQTIAEFSVFTFEREAVFYYAMKQYLEDADQFFEDHLADTDEEVPKNVWSRIKWFHFDSAMCDVLFHYVPYGWFLPFTIFDSQHNIEWDAGNFDYAFGNWFYQGLQYDEDIFIRDLKELWFEFTEN